MHCVSLAMMLKLNENVTNSKNWAAFASDKFKMLLKY